MQNVYNLAGLNRLNAPERDQLDELMVVYRSRVENGAHGHPHGRGANQMDIQVGDRVRLIGTDITGSVDDVTGIMSDDDRTLEAVAVRFIEHRSRRPIRATASEVEILKEGQSNG